MLKYEDIRKFNEEQYMLHKGRKYPNMIDRCTHVEVKARTLGLN